MNQYKNQNGTEWFDIRKAVSILDEKSIGRNIFLEYLRELEILDANNYPKEKYKTLLKKSCVVTKTGFYTTKILINNSGLEYFKENNIYEKIRRQDKIYLERSDHKG